MTDADRIPATLQDWIEACAMAWGALCHGQGGWHVQPREAWPSAISRAGAQIMNHYGYGLVPDYDADQWDEVPRALALRPSCAADGLIAGAGGLRVPKDSLPPEPDIDAERRAAVEAEWEKVPVFE